MSSRRFALKTAIIVCTICFITFSLSGFSFPDKNNDMSRPTLNAPTRQHLAPESDILKAAVPPPTPAIDITSEPDVTEKTYTDEDLDVLSRIIYAEVGCTWIPDEVQLYTGSVVLNRVASNLFPDTIHDVVFQEGQYPPTWNGAIDNVPDERTIANAKKLLEDGSVLPANVIFQANFTQGAGVYDSYYDEPLGTTTYFCYGTN